MPGGHKRGLKPFLFTMFIFHSYHVFIKAYHSFTISLTSFHHFRLAHFLFQLNNSLFFLHHNNPFQFLIWSFSFVTGKLYCITGHMILLTNHLHLFSHNFSPNFIFLFILGHFVRGQALILDNKLFAGKLLYLKFFNHLISKILIQII